MRTKRGQVLLTLIALAGCASGLKLTPIKNTQQKPSNVAVYFKVETSSGDPVGGLAADSFRIYEDDGLISQYESKQTILNPEVAASHYTLLLIDMSGSVSESGNADSVVEAATTFAERVGKLQKVAVYTFDGSADIHPIVPFTTAPEQVKEAIKGLSKYKPQDPSTNLNGAVVKGLDELDDALSHAEHPMRFGTLVVFTDGTDRAARVSEEDMKKAMKDDKHEGYGVFAIGLGAEIKKEQLDTIGRDGTAMAADKNAVVQAFDQIGQKIEAATRAYYLLSYCSPARAGKHIVKIEAVFKDDKGNSTTGSLQRDFDATGFTSGCDPKTPPNFDVTKGDLLAPPPDTGTAHPSGGGGAPQAPNLPPPPPPSATVTATATATATGEVFTP
jgi:hypothetical protein